MSMTTSILHTAITPGNIGQLHFVLQGKELFENLISWPRSYSLCTCPFSIALLLGCPWFFNLFISLFGWYSLIAFINSSLITLYLNMQYSKAKDILAFFNWSWDLLTLDLPVLTFFFSKTVMEDNIADTFQAHHSISSWSKPRNCL